MGTSIDPICARHWQNVYDCVSVCVLCDVAHRNPQKLISCMETRKCNQYPCIYDCEWRPVHFQYLVERIIDCHHRHIACMKLFWEKSQTGGFEHRNFHFDVIHDVKTLTVDDWHTTLRTLDIILVKTDNIILPKYGLRFQVQ